MNLKANYIDRQALEKSIKRDLNQTTLLYVNLLCATLIACVGLNYNSTTTIIGAMLISPLMSAITGIGYGFGTANYAIVEKAGMVFAIQFLIIFFDSALFLLDYAYPRAHLGNINKKYNNNMGYFGGSFRWDSAGCRKGW